MAKTLTAKNVYIFELASRASCSSCKQKLHGEKVYGAYEYFRCRKHLIMKFCVCCFTQLKFAAESYANSSNRKVNCEWKCREPVWFGKSRFTIPGEEPFILALCEKKIDPNLRLIYADFLEENGLPEYAEHQRHIWKGMQS